MAGDASRADRWATRVRRGAPAGQEDARGRRGEDSESGGVDDGGPVQAEVRDGHAAMLAGCLTLVAGAAMTLAAIETASAAAFLAGTAVAGAGSGTGFFLGAYRILTPLAGPGQRASLIAAICPTCPSWARRSM